MAPADLPEKLEHPAPTGRIAPDAPLAQGGLPEKLELLWTFRVPKGGFQSSAAIVDGVVYVGSLNGKFYAVDLARGRQIWEFPTEFGFTASAAVRDGAVYVGDSNGRFYCLDAKTGKEKWHFDTDAEINSSANFYGDQRAVRLAGRLALLPQGGRRGAGLEVPERRPDPLLPHGRRRTAASWPAATGGST